LLTFIGDEKTFSMTMLSHVCLPFITPSNPPYEHIKITYVHVNPCIILNYGKENLLMLLITKMTWEHKVVLLEEQLNQHVDNVFDQPLQEFWCFVTSRHDDETSFLAQG
jgi:hypothetical protein